MARTQPSDQGHAARDRLDSGFEDSERSGRGAADIPSRRSVSRSDSIVTVWSISVSERSEPERTYKDSEDHLGSHIAARQGTVLSPLLSSLDLRHTAQRRGCSGRVGRANASPGRRASLKEIFVDETADEARGSGEAQPPSETKCLLKSGGASKSRCAYCHGDRVVSTILPRFRPEIMVSRWKEVRKYFRINYASHVGA